MSRKPRLGLVARVEWQTADGGLGLFFDLRLAFLGAAPVGEVKSALRVEVFEKLRVVSCLMGVG